MLPDVESSVTTPILMLTSGGRLTSDDMCCVTVGTRAWSTILEQLLEIAHASALSVHLFFKYLSAEGGQRLSSDTRRCYSIHRKIEEK